MVFQLWSAAMLPVAIVHHMKPLPNVKRTYGTIGPSEDGRHEARVFALAMGVLFSIIFVLHAVTF